MVRHLATFLKQATDTEFGMAKQMCKTIGPVLVKPMSDALMGEDNAAHGAPSERHPDLVRRGGPRVRQRAAQFT